MSSGWRNTLALAATAEVAFALGGRKSTALAAEASTAASGATALAAAAATSTLCGVHATVVEQRLAIH